MAASTELLIKLKADGKQARSELDKTSAGMKKLGNAAKLAAKAGAAAFAALAVAGVKAFADFERGMNEVFTLLPGISQAAMDDMSNQVKSLAVDMGVLPEDVIPALYQALSAGVPEGNVFDFLETATELSVAGVTSMETAVDGLTTIVNAYGVENVSAQEAADSLFTAMKQGKTTVDEMSRALFQVVPVAAATGVSIDTVGAALAAITAQGTPTRVAATQLRQVLAELGKAGSIAFEAFEDAAGTTFPKFIKGGGTLQQALAMMSEGADVAGGSITDSFGSIEAGMAALTLTGDTGAAAWGANMDAMNEKTGAVSEGFAQMDQGLSRGFDRLKAVFSVLLVDIGEALAAPMGAAIDLAIKLGESLSKLKPAFVQLGKLIEGLIWGLQQLVDQFDGTIEQVEEWKKLEADEDMRQLARAVGDVNMEMGNQMIVDYLQSMIDMGAATDVAEVATASLGETTRAAAADALLFSEAAGDVGIAVEGLIDPLAGVETATREVIGVFAELPDQVEKTVAEMQKAFEENMRATAAWTANLELLTKQGMDQMRAEFEAMGIAYAGVLDDMVNSTGGELATMEFLIKGTIGGLVAFFNGNTALAASAARWAGNAAAAATSAWNAHFQPSASIPAVSVGGAIVRRHEGGIVPGSPGQEVPILAKAGETVLPTHLPGKDGRGGGDIVINIEGFLGSQEELVDGVRRALLLEDSRGSAGISV